MNIKTSSAIGLAAVVVIAIGVYFFNQGQPANDTPSETAPAVVSTPTTPQPDTQAEEQKPKTNPAEIAAAEAEKDRFGRVRAGIDQEVRQQLNYPRNALNKGIEGEFLVSVDIDANGQVAKIAVAEAENVDLFYTELEKSVHGAVAQYFSAHPEDKGVTLITIPVQFKIKEG
jgi:TonB family protein